MIHLDSSPKSHAVCTVSLPLLQTPPSTPFIPQPHVLPPLLPLHLRNSFPTLSFTLSLDNNARIDPSAVVQSASDREIESNPYLVMCIFVSVISLF